MADAEHDMARLIWTGLIGGGAGRLVDDRWRVRAELSVALGHADRAVSGGRADRHHRAHHRRAHADRARPDRDRRERQRRRRQHRHRPRRALGARRLHARHRARADPRHQRRDPDPAVRRGEGLRAGHADRRHAAMAGGARRRCRRTISRS